MKRTVDVNKRGKEKKREKEEEREKGRYSLKHY